MKKRSNEFWESIVLHYYTDLEWLESFRMSKMSFLKLCDLLKNELQPKMQFLKAREPVSVKKQVAIALYKIASCSEYRVVGNVFGVHKSTVKKCLYRVIKAINEVMVPTYINMPCQDEAEYITMQFENMSHSPYHWLHRMEHMYLLQYQKKVIETLSIEKDGHLTMFKQ